jgi:chromosome partitioning protein
MAGKKILVIDLDPQAHATFGLGMSGRSTEKTVYNILTDNAEKQRTANDCILNVSKNLDIVPSNILLSTLEQELADKEGAVSKLHQSLTTTTLAYNYVIIDCPPSLGFLTFNALRAADFVLVPIDMCAFSLMGVGKLLGMLELIKLKINHAPRVSAVATMFDKRTKYSQTVLDEIKAFFKTEMLETTIRMSVALKKAAAKGTSVMQFDSESNGAKDYTALAQEILKADAVPEFEKAMAEVSQAFQEVAVAATRTAVSEALDNAISAVSSTAPRTEIVREAAAASDRGLEALPADKPKDILFSFDAPAAKDVYLVGDFNHWKINEGGKLSMEEGGKWGRRISLAPGRYRYKFVVDGEWVLDSTNPEKESNPFGTFNSVIKF